MPPPDGPGRVMSIEVEPGVKPGALAITSMVVFPSLKMRRAREDPISDGSRRTIHLNARRRRTNRPAHSHHVRVDDSPARRRRDLHNRLALDLGADRRRGRAPTADQPSEHRTEAAPLHPRTPHQNAQAITQRKYNIDFWMQPTLMQPQSVSKRPPVIAPHRNPSTCHRPREQKTWDPARPVKHRQPSTRRTPRRCCCSRLAGCCPPPRTPPR